MKLSLNTKTSKLKLRGPLRLPTCFSPENCCIICWETFHLICSCFAFWNLRLFHCYLCSFSLVTIGVSTFRVQSTSCRWKCGREHHASQGSQEVILNATVIFRLKFLHYIIVTHLIVACDLVCPSLGVEWCISFIRGLWCFLLHLWAAVTNPNKRLFSKNH